MCPSLPRRAPTLPRTPGRSRPAVASPDGAHSTRGSCPPASAVQSEPKTTDAERGAPANPFAPPDETEPNMPSRPRSLFGEILDWMLAPLLLLWPMSIAVTYLVAKTIANGPFDRGLETDAYVLARQIRPVNGVATLTLPDAARDFLTGDNTDKVFYQVIGTRGELVAGVPDMPLPNDDDRPQPGLVEFRDASLHGNDIRIAYTTVALPGNANASTNSDANENTSPGARTTEGTEQSVLIQVGETFDKRSALANEIIKGVILPQFVILPLAIVLVWFGLSRGLAPLTSLQANLRARRPDDLSPLEASSAPPEIEPLVTSFNDLLTRLAQNIDLQKRFIADAAHQMKTPLAGLHMQAELALRDDVSPEVRRSLEQIATGADQAARLVTQLLALARAENRMSGQVFTSVELAQLARLAVRDWVRAALVKHMDLGYEGPDEPVFVNGNPIMLREMLSNVIDNAIRYTPAGGRITVRVRPLRAAQRVRIEVEDTGPGIAPAERPKVIERFYRILGREGDGSGLGLAIVREIATMHGGTLTLDDHVYQTSPRLAGTLVRIELPIAEPVGLP